jgi:hypothetical protein
VFTVVVMAIARWVGLTPVPAIRNRSEVLELDERGGPATEAGSELPNSNQ